MVGRKSLKKDNGFSLAELLIVIFIIAIMLVLALPQVISSRRLFRFSSVQKQFVSVLRETRQEALSQRTAITFRYDDTNKRIIISGGSLGNVGDSRNRVFELTGNGLTIDEVIYGRPPESSITALGDGTNLANLTNNTVDITFESDGSVIDTNNNPQNKAFFFYSSQTPVETAFAVSVLGAGGRIKVWRYSQGANVYVE